MESLHLITLLLKVFRSNSIDHISSCFVSVLFIYPNNQFAEMVAQFVPRVLPLHSSHICTTLQNLALEKRAHVEPPKIAVLLVATRGAMNFHVKMPNFTHENNNFKAHTTN